MDSTQGVGDECEGRSVGGGGGRFRHLVEHIQDAVVEFELVDGEPIVREVNQAFVDVFGYDREEILGESLNAFVVPSWLKGEADSLDDRTAAGKINYRHVRRETADGLREFLYRGIPYESDHTSGFAVYTDLTDTRRKTRQLEVVERVLRHNIRNELNVVVGAADHLEASVDDEAGDAMVDAIREAAVNLQELTGETTAIQRVQNERVPENASVDCVRLVRSVADRFRRTHPEAEIEVAVPDPLRVAATERLEAAVSALVENAIEHNPAERPKVCLEVRSSPERGWVEIGVADDGPEIPAMERQVVTGEAEITQTYHGSGLGLWLVRWTVESFGGDISFAESEAGGNRVRMRLRRADG